jgi:hypothetical protein
MLMKEGHTHAQPHSRSISTGGLHNILRNIGPRPSPCITFERSTSLKPFNWPSMQALVKSSKKAVLGSCSSFARPVRSSVNNS